MTFEEFADQAYQDEEGVFVVNGDEAFEESMLRAVYDDYLDSWSRANGGDIVSTAQELIVNRVGGVDDKLSSSRQLNITYCVSQASFGSRYNTVVSAMNSAAAAWEGTGARVNFVHSSQYDGNCTSTQSNVFFDVRQVSTNQYLARAFFPSSSRRSRNVLIATSAFGNISPWTLTGVLRHELGHALGFRHEHTRPEAGVCFENNSWRALTTYDSSSVMHYPQCNGTQTGDLVLTSRDASGARALYP
jgi:hypothetical protein